MRVVLAEDSYLVREGTAALLATVPEVELVAVAEDLDQLLAAAAVHRPDIVITDIRMPPTHTTEGLQAAARIRTDFPGTGVVVLSQYSDPRYAQELLSNGAAGLGYLLKERIADIDELTRALSAVAAGGSALDPRLVEALIARHKRQANSPLARLTGREREVLEEMAQGKNNTAISRALFLTERAVEKHINSVFRKLDLSESVDAHRRVVAVLTLLKDTTERA